MQRSALFLLAMIGVCACDPKTPKQDPNSAAGEGEHPATSESNQSTAGRVGSHGMVVAGTSSTAFLSHIPMFGNPLHDVQMVAAGSFTSLTATAVPVSFSESLHTFVPDKMSLDALRLGSLTELQGTIFLGNFEQGGRPVTRAKFSVARVVHQHVLEPGATSPDLSYVVFGSRAHALAVHRIAGQPSFDEVLRVELGGDPPSDAELVNGVEVHVSGSRDDAASRLGGASEAKPAAAGAHTLTVKPMVTLSCLEGPEFGPACN